MDLSFIIPCYKSKYISRTLDSIFNIEHYKVTYEVIVCCENETDHVTIKNIKDGGYLDKVKIVYSREPGVTSNRNKGIMSASGKHCYFLDSDDDLDNDFFAAYKKYKELDFDMLYGSGKNFSKPPIFDGVTSKTKDYDSFYSDRSLIQFSYCAYIFKLSFIKDNQLYVDNKVINAEDYLFIAMCLTKNPSLYLCKEFYFTYNISNESLSNNQTLEKCLVVFDSFKRLFDIFEAYNMEKCKKRYAEIFVDAVLEGPIFLSKQERKICSESLKKIQYKKIVRFYRSFSKKMVFLLFNPRFVWWLIKSLRHC